MRTLKILTWHVHGSYLYYLTQCRHHFYLPVKEGRPEGYGGRCGTLPWGENVRELAAAEVRTSDFDCIVFQSRKNYLVDQHEILSEKQRRLPRIYLEHDPPREHPTDTRHVADDPELLLVHVTHFNRLMWDSGSTPSVVIEHGVTVPEGVLYSGVLPRGLVVANGLPTRGRRLGMDVLNYVRARVPLDVVGMQSETIGGRGEVDWRDLHVFEGRYRFFFNPIRYTSLGLAVCEAMMLGMPIVGLATTEMPGVIRNGFSGYLSADVDWLVQRMRELLQNRSLAASLGRGARDTARKRFNISRFIRDWEELLRRVTAVGISPKAERQPDAMIYD